MKTRRLMSNSRNAPVVKLPFAGQDDTDKSSIGSCSKFCKHLHYVCWFSFFWASSSFIHILATLDFGAGVEQTFDCPIVENRQAVQSTGRLMDWTLEDNMVDGLFFCATLTGRRGGMPHLHKQERKNPTSVRRRLRRTQAVLGRVVPRGWVPVSGKKVRSLVGLSARSAFHWWSAQCAARMLLLNKPMSVYGWTAGINGCLDLRRRAFTLDGQWFVDNMADCSVYSFCKVWMMTLVTVYDSRLPSAYFRTSKYLILFEQELNITT